MTPLPKMGNWGFLTYIRGVISPCLYSRLLGVMASLVPACLGRLCPRGIFEAQKHLRVEVSSPQFTPLKPQSPPVRNLNGCLFIV